MTHTEALRLALDALEESVDLVRNEYATDWRHGLPTRKAQLDRMADRVKAHELAIEACRAALAAPSVPSGEPVAWFCEWFNADGSPEWDQYHDCTDPLPADDEWEDRPPDRVTPLYAAPQPAPAGWRLVPETPTEAMEVAFDDAHHRAYFTQISYAAMLAAAPAAPGG